MRLVTFQKDGRTRPGLKLDERTILDVVAAAKDSHPDWSAVGFSETWHSALDIISAGQPAWDLCAQLLHDAKSGALEKATLTASTVGLLAPIPRPLKNVFCVGSNYRAHVSEASRAQEKEDKAPDHPVFFTKPPTAVVGPSQSIEVDARISAKMDYEVELGVVIGKAGRNISQAEAIDHIFGFTIINDISARDLQRRHGGQFLKGKGLDTSCPMGPEIVTLDELPNFDDLRISLTVNGEARQDGNTGSMIFPIPKLLESLSEGMTLEPGDVLATGTPSGVGYAMDPPQFLRDGDAIVCEIEGIGRLENPVKELSQEANAA